MIDLNQESLANNLYFKHNAMLTNSDVTKNYVGI